MYKYSEGKGIIMKNTSPVLVGVLCAIVFGAAGFFVGRHISARIGVNWANPNPMMARRMGASSMMKRGRFLTYRGGNGGSGVQGQITAVNGNAVTVKLANGNTSTVTLSPQAVVDVMTKGSVSDLKTGESIMVTGGNFWNNVETVIVNP